MGWIIIHDRQGILEEEVIKSFFFFQTSKKKLKRKFNNFARIFYLK